MSISWSTVQSALVTWIRTGSGYASGKVIWANQDGGRPSGNFCTVNLTAMTPLGALDELRRTQDLGRAGNGVDTVGTEIEHKVHGLRELAISVQCFTTEKTGDNCARAVLSKVQASLMLPTPRFALRDAGLGPFDRGVIRDVSALLDSDFEARAVLDLRFYVSEEVAEFSTYIEKCSPQSYMGPPYLGTDGLIDI